MRVALGRWKTGWDIVTGPFARENLQQTGFMRYAAIEFWYLARAIVEREENLAC